MAKTETTTNPDKLKLQILLQVLQTAIEDLHEGIAALPDGNEPTNPPPPPPTEPPAETGVIKPGGWGANQDPKTWTVVNMKLPPEQFKIVDDKGINVATNFTTKENAQKVIDYTITNTKPTNPPPTEPGTGKGALDAQGVHMIYKPKAGGQVVIATETSQKQSSHNTGSRTSLYSNKPYSAGTGELTEYFIMDLSDDGEQNAPKLLSGGHTGSGDSDETRQGRCYAVGVNQNGTLHLAKEYPYHPKTPKHYDKIKYVDSNWKNLGSVRNKKVGMKIIYYPLEVNGKKVMHIEWWFDKKGLQTGQVENDWQQMAYADDDGSWTGPALFENNGVLFNGKILGFYIRIDTPKKPVVFSNQGQHELDLPATKL